MFCTTHVSLEETHQEGSEVLTLRLLIQLMDESKCAMQRQRKLFEDCDA